MMNSLLIQAQIRNATTPYQPKELAPLPPPKPRPAQEPKPKPQPRPKPKSEAKVEIESPTAQPAAPKPAVIYDESVEKYSKMARQISPKGDSLDFLNSTCTYEYKIGRLMLMLNEVLESDARPASYVPAAIKIIRELNLMQGHYAPAKHLIANVATTPEQRERISQLIETYQGQY